jgi:hypothetical protein
LGGEAVGDERAAWGEEVEGALEAWAAEVVKDSVDAAGGERADAAGEVGVVVVDGFGAHVLQGVVVAG